MKITRETSLYKVRRAVWDAFGVAIDNDDARDVRRAIATGACLWTPDFLVTSLVNGGVARITPRGIWWVGGDYRLRAEQNAIMREEGWLRISDADINEVNQAGNCLVQFWARYAESSIDPVELRKRAENECGDKAARPAAEDVIPKGRIKSRPVS